MLSCLLLHVFLSYLHYVAYLIYSMICVYAFVVCLFVCLFVLLLTCMFVCVVYVVVVSSTHNIFVLTHIICLINAIYNSVLTHIFYRSTSPPGGNQVDGLPPALREFKSIQSRSTQVNSSQFNSSQIKSIQLNPLNWS